MKKVLFVLGLAMCCTFAMAQTNKVAPKLGNPNRAIQEKIVVTDNPVDYKASIFTKDDVTPLGYYQFAPAETVTIGTVATGDIIDGQAVAAAAAHNRQDWHLKWQRIADSATTHDTAAFISRFPGFLQYMPLATLNAYMGVRNGIENDNGFMLLSLGEDDAPSNNSINTYFALPAANLNSSVILVDVTWRQYYRKYYDECYLDYMLNGNWFSFEVNVTGVDVSVGGTAPAAMVATLPATVVAQDSLKIRFRLYASGGNWYGYGWAIDEVKILPVTTPARWSFNSEGLINGFYGTLPQGFQIPVSYTVFARNTSVDSLYGNTLAIHHNYEGGAWSEVFSVNEPGLPAGDPTADYVFDIDESGFMMSGVGFGDYCGYHAFPEYYSHYGKTDAQLAALNYGRRSLPTTQPGKHQFSVIANNGNGLNDTLELMTYTVSEDMDVDSTVGRTIPGYRWANDNGIIPGGREFAYGFSDDDPTTQSNDAGYVTSDCGHQYEQTYEVLTRYNTPSAIPTDNEGNPWVIRGIEYVTSTKLTSARVAGSTIAPLIYKYKMEDGDTGFYWYSASGLTGSYYQIDGTSAPADAAELIGYNTTESGNYYCYNILLPDQPALEPNVSFLLGYENGGGGDFAVASTAYSFKSGDGTNDYTSYSRVEELEDFYNQLTPANKVYDAYCYDPLQGARSDTSRHTVSGWNITTYPMIRLIVGPRMTIRNYGIYLDCGTTEGEYWIYNDGSNGCGTTDSLVQGSGNTYYVIPGPEDEMSYQDDNKNYYIDTTDGFAFNKVIDAIYLDGVAIDLDDENMVTKVPYIFYWPGHTPVDDDPWQPAVVRYYYAISLRGVNADHTITASCHTETLSIRNIEDNVNLTLAPNPATAQVRLNVAGFSGKANCSIIDMSGRVVYSADITAGESVINLNGVPAGAYFVRVTNEAFSKVEKLIVR